MTQPMSQSATAPAGPADEVVRICRDLIRIDSTNFGDGSGPGEREAADYVVGQLRALRGDVGMTPGDAAIVAQLKVLIAVLGARNGATGEAQAHRTASVLGAF